MLVKDMKIILKKKKKNEPQHGHERSKNLSENEKQKLSEHRKISQNEKKCFTIRKYLMWKISPLYKGKYKKLCSFVLMFEKFSLNKQKNMKMYFFEGVILKMYFLKEQLF